VWWECWSLKRALEIEMTEIYTVGAVLRRYLRKDKRKKAKIVCRIEPSTCGIEKESNRFIDDEP